MKDTMSLKEWTAMNKITLLAKSSSRDKPYKVTFILNDGSLSIKCDCPAGEGGQICNHILAVAANKTSILYDQSQVDLLQTVYHWIDNSKLSGSIGEMQLNKQELEILMNKFRQLK